MRRRTRAMILAAVAAVFALSSQVEALEWPFRIQAGDTAITIYMPQIETFEGDMLTARAAISLSLPELDTPVFGAIWFESYALTDRETRTVVLSDVRVMGARFPSLEGRTLSGCRELVEREVEEWEFLMTLDDLEAALEYVDTQQIAVEGIKNDPPDIYFRSSPAVLVTIDGEPKEQDLEDSSLRYVVNTPFFIVYDKKSSAYYLRGGPWWYSSKKVSAGYTPVDRIPGEVEKLAEAADKAAAEQAAEAPDSAFEVSAPPEIIVSTKPAELIVSEGEPDFTPVEGTDLLYMTNTDFDVFVDLKGQQYFMLISGRWYTAPSMEGDWKYIESDALPKDFAKIPPESENGHVLASVAGTEQARDAVLDMYVPQTAEVDRKEAVVQVEYDGQPKFEEIEDTDLTYAVNTSSSVIYSGDAYYCCDDAVWFTSPYATGPWTVCVEVPAVIYTIPPSCPLYNVVYVHVYDYTPDVVYVGYTPGYTCSYVYGGTVVYGTGYYYRPWYGHYYYPRPVTWGFGVHWNPYTGWGFSFGVRFGGPSVWFRVGWGPTYGYWGPMGYWGGYRRGYRHGYYHGARYGYAAGYRAGQKQAVSRNLYKNRVTGVKRTGEVRAPSTMPASTATRDRKQAAAKTRSDFYADKNGNVYRNDKGTWEKQGTAKDRSSKTQAPSGPAKSDLERYQNARTKGAQSNEQYQRQKSTGQRETRQPPTTQRDTRSKSAGSSSSRSSASGQRNTRPKSSGQRRRR